MSWASFYIRDLLAGQTVKFRPRGNSMKGRINSGDLCTVIPITDDVTLEPGDIVLCKVRGNQYLHLIQAKQDARYLIGNNRGGTNGWTGINAIYGKCVNVEP